ncbi:hypothetical protein HUN08_12640 [Gordonia sp. X0973]|uniref:hypothetical protein n=1 Tax=Gordonia sp. X0973 TaxID=2742602 RepID=UPI000F547EF3|nr:hypothetical protein [Gordonia sp. X0973]QKT07940.1 hypothetical protein HUN08_12640 [Gordonia sp. X0973]
MDIKPTTVIEYESPDGDVFCLAGPRAGNRGVWLGKGDISGFFDAPTKTHIQEVGTAPGAQLGGTKYLHREITFNVDILNEKGANDWLTRESRWRKAWSFTKPGILRVITLESGIRELAAYLFEQPEIDFSTDPNMKGINTSTMHVVAYDPFWYEESIEFDLTTQTDTTASGSEDLVFDIHPLDGKSGGLNPTDRPIDLTWVLEGTGKYTIPDYSFEKPALANRRIVLPEIVLADGDVVATSSKRNGPQFSATGGTPYVYRMNGVRLLNKVPEYTDAREFTVTATKTPPGRKVSLFLERPWSRPWGLE